MSEKTYDYFCREGGCEHQWSSHERPKQDQMFCPKCGSWKITMRDR